VTLDVRGRLLRFYEVADPLGSDSAPPAPAPDWRPAFAAAGLDYAAFATNPVTPRHRPPLATDTRFAWEGPYPDRLVTRVRVEAAALGGKPVYFAVEFPWQTGGKVTAHPTYDIPPLPPGFLVIFFGLPALAAVIAWWNWRTGRADLRGALTLGGALFAAYAVIWLLIARHVPDTREVLLLASGLGRALYLAATFTGFYLALEPYVRKRWPWQLVSWSRLLAGRGRDRLVARDVLVGLAAGVLVALLLLHYEVGPVWAPDLIRLNPFDDLRIYPVGDVLGGIAAGAAMGLTFFFVIFVIHWACRNRWIAALVFPASLWALYASAGDPKPATTAVTAVVTGGLLQFVALRFGLLAFVSSLVCETWLLTCNWSLDVRAWFATGPNLAIALLVGLAVYCAYVTTDGRLFGKHARDG